MTNQSPIMSLLSSRWVKITVAAVIVALLVYYNRIDGNALINLRQTWPWLLAALTLMLPPYLIVSYRFGIILKSQGFKIGFNQAVRWTMIGSFFDLAMPSSSGGDLIKAGMVARHVGTGLRTRAVMAVAFDRFSGLLGLFLLALISSQLGWDVLRNMPSRRLVFIILLFSSVGAILALRIMGSRRLLHNQTINRLLTKNAMGLRIRQFITSFNCIRERPLLMLGALVLSVVNHVFWCASLFSIANAIGCIIDPVKGFVVFPLAIFSNIFGVAGGFGIGTLGFDILLSQLLGIDNGALIGLLFQSLGALSRLIGLPYYLSSPSDETLFYSQAPESGETALSTRHRKDNSA